MFDLGQVAHLQATALDADGNPADVATMQLVVTTPDGIPGSQPNPTHTELGVYSYDFTPVQAGRHFIAWSGSGGAAGNFAWTEVLNVWPADPRFLLGLADARAALRKLPGSSTSDDEQLRFYIAAVTPVIEDITGPLIKTSRTIVFNGGNNAVCLPAPVESTASVTAVTENGSPISDFTVDPVAGIVYAGSSLGPRYFMPGQQNVSVTATYGSGVIPPNTLMAAREELRFLWQLGQQANRPAWGDQPDDVEFTPSGFAVPRRVVELCTPSVRFGGFA